VSDELIQERRIYVLVRGDLGPVPSGKMMAQAGHAVLGAFVLNDAMMQHIYMKTSQAKIVLEVENEVDLALYAFGAESLGIPYAVIKDEGRTVFPEPTVTCVGIGPITKETSILLGLDKLKLFKK